MPFPTAVPIPTATTPSSEAPVLGTDAAPNVVRPSTTKSNLAAPIVTRVVVGTSPFIVAAGAELVSVVVVADDVTVQGVAVPAGTSVPFGGVAGHRLGAITVTAAAAGDAVVVEERP